MIGTIAVKTLRQSFLEARFVLASALTVSLFALSSLGAVSRHHRALAEHRDDLRVAYEESDLEALLVVQPPHPLDFVSDHGWRAFPRLARLEPERQTTVGRGEVRGSFLAAAEELDWARVIGVVLSLLAIFLAFDAVAREREQGTLSLIFSYPLSRARFLAGSWLGLMTALCLPLAIGLLLGGLIVGSSAGYELTAGHWLQLALVAVAAVLYLALFVAGSLLASSLCRDSSTALVWLILVWVLLIVVLPGNGSLLAALHEAPPERLDEWRRVAEVRRQYQLDLVDYSAQVRAIVEGGGEPERIQHSLDLLRDRIVADQRRQLAERDRLVLAIEGNFQARRLRQMVLSRRSTVLSPAVAFREAIEGLLSTGMHDHRRFLAQAQAYQRSVAAVFDAERRRRAPAAQERNAWQVTWQGFSMRGAPERSYAGIRPEPGAFQPFAYRRSGLRDGLAACLPELAALLASAAALLLAALVALARYDVRYP